jgi:phosphoribosylformylglycinamidine synthase
MTENAATTWLAKVRVVLKPAINDPQGRAIENGLRALAFQGVEQVRAGKYLEIRLAAPTEADARRQTDDMCRKLLANPVIEDYTFDLEAATASLSAPQS